MSNSLSIFFVSNCGCTINLVKDELYDTFIEEAVKQFTEKFGHAPKIYPVVISDGARKL